MTNINRYLFWINNKEESDIKSTELIRNKNSRKNKLKLSKTDYEETKIEWTLFKYIKELEYDSNGCEFLPESPSQQLNNGISAASILEIINSDLIFEYLPQRNDMLNISMEYLYATINNKSRPYIGNYLSFIYKDEWLINKGFEHIDNIYEIISEGIIEVT